VQTARSAEEALTIMQDVIPAVLIVDVMLLNMPGYDLCASVKHDKRLKDVPPFRLTTFKASVPLKCGIE
jgi:response regulator RpfG family c-di-GMP phosphodiesterase